MKGACKLFSPGRGVCNWLSQNKTYISAQVGKDSARRRENSLDSRWDFFFRTALVILAPMPGRTRRDSNWGQDSLSALSKCVEQSCAQLARESLRELKLVLVDPGCNAFIECLMSSCNVVICSHCDSKSGRGGMSKSKSCLRASNRKCSSKSFLWRRRQDAFVNNRCCPVTPGLQRFICIVKMWKERCQRVKKWMSQNEQNSFPRWEAGWEHDGTRGCFPLIHILASVSSTDEKLQDVAKLFIKICSYHGFVIVVRFQQSGILTANLKSCFIVSRTSSEPVQVCFCKGHCQANISSFDEQFGTFLDDVAQLSEEIPSNKVCKSASWDILKFPIITT